MKTLTVINIEKAIQEYESEKGYKFNVSAWDLACRIFEFILEEKPFSFKLQGDGD